MDGLKAPGNFSGYDFLDFGCSGGASIEAVRTLFPGTRGLGLDNDPRKIAAATAQGHDVHLCDVTTLTAAPRQVRFVVMSHFLEHLPGREAAAACVRGACTVSTDFVYIRQPWFDADGYLFQLGLKCYWSDWKGHPYHMTALDLQLCLGALLAFGEIARFALYGCIPVKDSGADCIHPLSSPTDQQRWDPTKHPPKPQIAFSIQVWRELRALVTIGSADFEALERHIGLPRRIYDSAAAVL